MAITASRVLRRAPGAGMNTEHRLIAMYRMPAAGLHECGNKLPNRCQIQRAGARARQNFVQEHTQAHAFRTFWVEPSLHFYVVSLYLLIPRKAHIAHIIEARIPFRHNASEIATEISLHLPPLAHVQRIPFQRTRTLHIRAYNP